MVIRCNIQDNVVIHGLKLEPHEKCSVYIGDNVSIAHQALVHGPASIGDKTFIGFQAMVCSAKVGKDCVIEIGARVVNCSIPDGRYVPAGQVIDLRRKQIICRVSPRVTSLNTLMIMW